MMLWHFLVVINVLVAVSVKPGVGVESDNDWSAETGVPISDTKKIDHNLLHRLEAVEVAIQTIVLTLSSHKSDLFIPINQVFDQNPTIRSILSLAATHVLPNNTVSNIDDSLNVTVPINSSAHMMRHTEGRQGRQRNDSNVVDNLKGAVKCSLAHLVDINTIGMTKSLNQSTHIKASLKNNESLEITWSAPSAECLTFSSGVWIRIYESGDELSSIENILTVPQNCLTENSPAASFSIVLSPPSPSSASQEEPCRFSLAKRLIQCRAYTVEIIPNYQSFRGKTVHTEFVVPPKLNSQSIMKPLVSVLAHSSSLMLNWEDNSGCAPQLTSFDLKVFKDGIVNDDEGANATVRIPRSCLKRPTKEDNLFSLVLPTKQQACSVDWKPLDKCRKYRLDMSSQYSSTWNGPSSSWEIFTAQEGNYSVNFGDTLRCPRDHYYCHGNCYPLHYMCNHGYCDRYCDQFICQSGFKCRQQCVPKELVCNGEYDCVDGADEGYDCSTAYDSPMCNQLTSPSGHLSSVTLPKPTGNIHPDKSVNIVQKTTILISVKPNHQIWLTFDKFSTLESEHFVKIYDGPYSTSPLLLSHSGQEKPLSVRSSSNDLFVEFPSYHDTNYGISAFYTSVNRTEEPYVPGCGGYINNGNGVVSIPYFFIDPDVSDCFWFIESKQSDDTILLRRNFSEIAESSTNALFSRAAITVYDGWNRSGLLLYDGNVTDLQQKVVYSVSHKMTIHLKPSVKVSKHEPRVFLEGFLNWNVFKISTPQCKYYLQETTVTIKSPNYPRSYPNLTDCRWNIFVSPGSKIRLLFAFFETREEADFIYVFDGPTAHSPLLLKESGALSTPFVVTSTTNEVLIRFTSSDRSEFLPGFLAVYSSV